MKLRVLYLTISSEEPIVGTPAEVRGFFATNFPEYNNLHNHIAGTRYLYQYPYIQYRILNGSALVIGIEKGAEDLFEIYDKFDNIRIQDRTYPVFERDIIQKEVPFGLDNIFHSYDFITPWLALNQENYQRFYRAKSAGERHDLLRRTLAGNLLSMSKSLGYQVPDRIRSEVEVQPLKQRLKDVNVMAFAGRFHANFQIPDYLGIGKSVSRGFGAVRQLLPDGG